MVSEPQTARYEPPNEAAPRSETGSLPAMWPQALGLFVLCALFFLWTVFKPGSHELARFVDDVGQFLIILAAMALAFVPLGVQEWRTGTPRWVPRLFALGMLGYVVGQVVWTYYENALDQPPFPSWADAFYLSAYPFLFAAILLVPAPRPTSGGRIRLVLDGLILLTAATGFSWYFVLGPTALQSGEGPLAKVVGTAYPLFDLVLVFCLFLLWFGVGAGALRRAVGIVSAAVLIIIVTDTLFDYLTIAGNYSVPSLIDVGWPLGYGMIGLGIYALRPALVDAIASKSESDDMVARAERGERMRLWRLLVPYAPIPLLAVLDWYVISTARLHVLSLGVEIDSGVLVLLILIHQIVAIRENERLREREEEFIREVGVLTVAAREVEAGSFHPGILEPLAERHDALGQLARVFHGMASEVRAREQQLHQQVQQLQVRIDQAKKERQVAEITETDYFRDLQARAQLLRAHTREAGSDDGNSG